MDRRAFIAGSAVLAAVGTVGGAEAKVDTREVYALTLYRFSTREKLERYAEFLKSAWLPAHAAAGLPLCGAFVPADKADDLTIYLLSTYHSLESMSAADKLISDALDTKYAGQSSAVIGAAATDPAFVHCESSLLGAFKSWPHIHAPTQTNGDQSRVFELRTYESHSKAANLKKIEMFDKGETAIFARCGFQPVFFGETLFGPQVPNLTYMVTYPGIEARDGYWKAFGADPEKARLFAIPEYADKLIVSKIHSTFLKPLPGSFI